MANTETFIMEGRLLTSLLIVHRRALGVDDAQDEDRCVACSRTESQFVTDAGENIFRNTGICEICADVVESNVSTLEAKKQQCVALSEAGLTVAKSFLRISRAAHRLYFWSDSDFRRAERIAMERDPLPVARR